jgi:hypothetical protein
MYFVSIIEPSDAIETFKIVKKWLWPTSLIAYET